MTHPRLLLLLHLLGVVLFYGNLAAAWLLYTRARRAAGPAEVAALFGVMNTGDRWITPLSVVLITATGVASAIALHLPLLGTAWIAWSIAAFAASGIVFVARLAGLQRRLEAAGRPEHWDPAAYHRLRRQWRTWALLATLAALIPLFLMVLRPGTSSL